MDKSFQILLIIFTFGFVGCGSLLSDKPSEEVVVEKHFESDLQAKNDTTID
jgi:hypothetical protein